MYLRESESMPGSHLAEPPPAATCTLLETFDGFDIGDYRLKPAHYERLIRIARLTPGFTGMRLFLLIEGHTDRSGPELMNAGLSANRAAEVHTFLTRMGASGRVDVVGVGEGRPRRPNNTAEGRRQNRRVEIRLCPLPPPPLPPSVRA